MSETKMQHLRHGGWFNFSAATEFVQDKDLGKNEPERIYFTKKANWVLYALRDDEWGFTAITPGAASHWLLTKLDWIKNKGKISDDIKMLFDSTEV